MAMDTYNEEWEGHSPTSTESLPRERKAGQWDRGGTQRDFHWVCDILYLWKKTWSHHGRKIEEERTKEGRAGGRERKRKYALKSTNHNWPSAPHTCLMRSGNSPEVRHSQFQHLWDIDNAYVAVSVMTKDNPWKTVISTSLGLKS